MSVATQAPALTEVLRSWGFREDPILVRGGHDTIYRTSGCAVRVSNRRRHYVASECAVSLSRLRGTTPSVSFVRCLFGPTECDEGTVTAWEWVEASRQTRLTDIGTFAGALYGAQPSADVGHASPLSEIRRNLRDFYRQGSPTRQERETLDAAFEGAQRAWGVYGNRHRGVIHGDLSVENVIASESRIVAIDLEWSGCGPQAWDMVPVHLGALFGHDQSEVDEAFDAYRLAGGECPLEDIEGLTPILLLAGATWALSKRHSGATFYSESMTRLQSLDRDWRDAPRWTLVG